MVGLVVIGLVFVGVNQQPSEVQAEGFSLAQTADSTAVQNQANPDQTAPQTCADVYTDIMALKDRQLQRAERFNELFVTFAAQLKSLSEDHELDEVDAEDHKQTITDHDDAITSQLEQLDDAAAAFDCDGEAPGEQLQKYTDLQTDMVSTLSEQHAATVAFAQSVYDAWIAEDADNGEGGEDEGQDSDA